MKLCKLFFHSQFWKLIKKGDSVILVALNFNCGTGMKLNADKINGWNWAKDGMAISVLVWCGRNAEIMAMILYVRNKFVYFYKLQEKLNFPWKKQQQKLEALSVE